MNDTINELKKKKKQVASLLIEFRKNFNLENIFMTKKKKNKRNLTKSNSAKLKETNKLYNNKRIN